MLIKNLKYDGYDTGSYGESRADGITLHFFSEDTSLQYYTIFNVNRTKQRGPSKGSKLTGKRFWITKRFAFYHFWYQTCGLPVPSKGLTTFHDRMGKLSSLTFQAETDDGKRLLKNTLKPIYPDSSLITIRQAPDKPPTISPDKQLQETDSETGFKEILTTCESNYDISKQGKTDTRIPLLASNTSYKDDNDWLSQCDELF
ncbi:hypothetical protein N9H96_01440 [Porticoccaceae bacterium]|nr:hypothetical protein [Porticoccaceae bacterium]